MTDSRKWMITRLIITMVALSASQVNGDRWTLEKTQMSVRVGDDVELHCGDNFTVQAGRAWRNRGRSFTLLSTVMVDNDRVTSVDSSTIVRIANVTLDDKGYYSCMALALDASGRFTMRERTVHLQVKEKPCEAPLKPLDGDYENETDIYSTGDTIRYHCDRGYQLIGEPNRTCTGTIDGWQPQEPHCRPEYIVGLMRRLGGIEDQVSVIEQRVTALEYNVSNMGEKISAMVEYKLLDNDGRMLEIAKQCANKEPKLYLVNADISLVQTLNPEVDRYRSRLIACTNKSHVVDVDTVCKCLTMQMGVRNGQSVSEFKWTLEDYKSIVTLMKSDHVVYNSEPFYHTVPGYKLRLRMSIRNDYHIWAELMFIPSDTDDQLRWPFSTPYDMTVLLNDGTEFLYKHFSRQNPSYICTFHRPSVEKAFNCFDYDRYWVDVMQSNKQHILKDGSITVKIYLYN